MGAPALDPAAGCLPAAVSPGFLFAGRSCSCFAGAIALAAWFPLPSPSPKSFPQTKVRPRATTSSGPKGRLPLSPVGTGDCRTAGLRDCSCRRRRRRWLGGGGLLPSSLPGFAIGTADFLAQRRMSATAVCWPKARRSLRRPFCAAHPLVYL